MRFLNLCKSQSNSINLCICSIFSLSLAATSWINHWFYPLSVVFHADRLKGFFYILLVIVVRIYISCSLGCEKGTQNKFIFQVIQFVSQTLNLDDTSWDCFYTTYEISIDTKHIHLSSSSIRRSESECLLKKGILSELILMRV